MNDTTHLSQVVEDGTAVLTLHHPPVNALSRSVLDELACRIQHLAGDIDICTVVIHSALPKFFSAGANIRELAAIRNSNEGRAYAERGQAVLHQIEHLPKPVIAAIDGVCLGGGLELALACPLRIATTASRLGLPEVNLGLLPGFGGTVRLSRILGVTQAMNMILLAKEIDGAEASRLGIVHQVVKPGAALETALELARQVQGKSKGSVNAILATLLPRDDELEKHAFEKEARLFGARFDTEDAKEGIRAFLEKRVPKFTGR
ncbi:enoyl-CoA hydratase-related protein [Nitrospina sp. 32_T5]|uniref:enoyl-CoA hydratase-related protein n=1 Tax=unclassified Nitrospina TaxID=2638683 RepID=UPI003F950369